MMPSKELTWLGKSPDSRNVHWMVPRVPNDFFTGREEILEPLEKTIRTRAQRAPGVDQCRVVIWGLGGQGKSEISLQLAQRVRSLQVSSLHTDR